MIRGGEDTYLELKLKLSNPAKIAQEIVALANTDGGAIIFGVTDQLRVAGVRNPEGVQEELVRICRSEIYPPLVPLIDMIAFDNGLRVIALDIVSKNRPYRTSEGKFFIRIGAEKREATREELSVLIDEVRPLFYENIPMAGVAENDIDDGLLWGFADGFGETRQGSGMYQTKNFLRKDLLMEVGMGETFLPTVAGLLLFGKEEAVAKALPHASLTAMRYSGIDESSPVIEKIDFNTNLLNAFEQLLSFIERYCDLWKYKSKEINSKESDSLTHPRGNYHMYSVKEAVANLLVHRDLAIRDLPTRVSIFDNAIEFTNPRRTNGFAPLGSKAIRFGITQRINPQISAVFSRREYGIRLPQGGLPMILKQSQLFSGERVELKTNNDQFSLKIKCA